MNYLLEGTRKVVTEVSVQDLDRAITTFLKEKNYTDENFNKYGYESVAENEWDNLECHTMQVVASMPTKREMENIKYLYSNTRRLLNWMCAENRIEAGEYLISVFW